MLPFDVMADKDKDWEGVESEFTYKPSGPQKTVNEYAELDKEDESLQKWKASLGIVPGQSLPEVDPNDQRRVIIQSIALETQGRPDVMVNLTTKGALGSLKDKPFVIKEGITYRIKVTFRIQREVVSGLRYLQIVKRKGVKVDKLEEMIGSYGPRADPYEKKCLCHLHKSFC